jgi:hypothetical protein
MVVHGVRHAYQVVLDEATVLSESLHSYPERRRRVLFERHGADVNFRRGLGGQAGTRELLTPTTLALSAAMRFDEPEIRDFGRAVAGIGVLGNRKSASWRRLAQISGGGIGSTMRMFDDRSPAGQEALFELPESDMPNDRRSALALLRFADLGIDDVLVTEELEDPAAVAATQFRRGSRRQLRFVHRVAGEQIAFDADEESEGTRTWFGLIGPVLRALKSGRILLFDEIDASLHPRLSAKLLELFQDPSMNPLGAQLIFTTHDTSLLNHLNRDEVWLTEKKSSGATSLVALAEYGGDKVRRSMNLEKAYLQGRFGAVPELDQVMLHRALGLAVIQP